MDMRNESEAFAELDDQAGIDSQNLRDVRKAFHDTQPNDDTEQLESIRRGMPLRDVAQWIGISLGAFWLFCFIAGLVAEQVHGL